LEGAGFSAVAGFVPAFAVTGFAAVVDLAAFFAAGFFAAGFSAFLAAGFFAAVAFFAAGFSAFWTAFMAGFLAAGFLAAGFFAAFFFGLTILTSSLPKEALTLLASSWVTDDRFVFAGICSFLSRSETSRLDFLSSVASSWTLIVLANLLLALL
jgi:hypothetical protein